MKLERCALCGRVPRQFIDRLNDHAGCGNRGCLMEVFKTMDRRFWNRLQSAIRKARKPGKVLYVGYVDGYIDPKRYYITIWHSDDPSDPKGRRVEVREVPKRRAGR